METIQSSWEWAARHVFPHWPGLSFILIMWVIAQTMKVRILTKKLAKRNKAVFWLRRVLPLILMLLGVIAGIIWPGETSPGVDTRPEKILYFMGCVAASVFTYNAVRTYVKKKHDIDIGITANS